AVRADIRLRYHTAQAVTETRSLLRSRILVGLIATPDAESRIKLFEQAALVFKNTGVAPLQVDMTGTTSDVVRANLGVRAAAAAVTNTGAGSAAVLRPAVASPELEATAASPVTVSTEDAKVCPDCAE